MKRSNTVERLTVITVSTAHVPESLGTATEGAPLMDAIAHMRGDDGWLVNVSAMLSPLDSRPESIVGAIAEVLWWAKRRGADYVLFDSDGPKLDRFAIYDWSES